MQVHRLFLATILLGTALPTTQAANFTILADPADVEINRGTVDDGPGTLAFAGATGRVGGSGGGAEGATGRNFIMPFQLPLIPAGETISTADFTAFLATRTGTPTFNADLYGVGFGTSATPPADYFEGTLDATSAVLIQDNFTLANATAATFSSTSPAGDSSLATYLSSLYTQGAVAGNFVYLRLSPDINFTNAQTVGFNFTTSGAPGTPNTVNAPTLAITTIPEPSVAALSLVGLVLAARRRRA